MKSRGWGVVMFGVLSACQLPVTQPQPQMQPMPMPQPQPQPQPRPHQQMQPQPPPPMARDDRASGARTSGRVVIPDVIGLARPDAEAKLRAAGVTGELLAEKGNRDADYATATACETVPAAGNSTAADLVVSVRYCTPPSADKQARRAEQAALGQQRAQTIPLIGLTPKDAAARARAAGWAALIEVSSMQAFGAPADASCAAGTVCVVRPMVWERDIGNPNGRLMLYVNDSPAP